MNTAVIACSPAPRRATRGSVLGSLLIRRAVSEGAKLLGKVPNTEVSILPASAIAPESSKKV